MTNEMKYFSGTGSKQVIALAVLLAISNLNGKAQVQTDKSENTSPVRAVKLSVLVLDASRHAVNDVTQDELRVVEDDVEQKVTFFTKERMPLSYGLVVDTSGSLRSMFQVVVATGRKIVSDSMPEDEGFVMRFVSSENIDIVQDFTSNKAALDRSLNELYSEGGQTALIDAVFVAALHMAKVRKESSDKSRNRVLFLISDGEDRESTSKAETLFEYLRKTDIQIYVIGLVSELNNDRELSIPKKLTRSASIDLLNRLANETGGRAFFLDSPARYSDAVIDILRDMRSRYTIGYSPAPNRKSKAYRSVKVKVESKNGAEKRIVVTRPGYVATNNERKSP